MTDCDLCGGTVLDWSTGQTRITVPEGVRVCDCTTDKLRAEIERLKAALTMPTEDEVRLRTLLREGKGYLDIYATHDPFDNGAVLQWLAAAEKEVSGD